MTIIQDALKKVVARENLSTEMMTEVMQALMQNQATPAQAGAFLIALRLKGETITEISAAAKVARELMLKVTIDKPHLLDIVGTGGDQANLFNISTTSAFVAAAAGAPIAKHNNRALTSRSGSADLLEYAKINIALPLEKIAAGIETIGIGFMFAPYHHTAWQHMAPIRRELGVRTLFNLLGPLTNPAQVPHALVGVYAPEWVEPIAAVLRELGLQHALVVHSNDGLDEISCEAPTFIAELKQGNILTYHLYPADFGFHASPIASLRVENSAQSYQLMQQVLNNQPGAARDIVALNSGAAIYAADLAPTIAAGIELAKATIASGAAKAKWLEFSAYLAKQS